MDKGAEGQAVDIAIVIVSYNTRELLSECLRSIYESRGGVTIEVYVVDNCSDDGSAEMARNQYPRIQRVITCETNRGYAAANNLGLKAAGFDGRTEGNRASYALLLNPDTVLPPTALREMLDFMDMRSDAGASGPKLVRPDGTLDWACRRSFPSPAVSFYRLVGLARLFPNHPRFARYNLTHLNPDDTAEVDSLVGAFMMIRGNALSQVGLLDEAFFMYGEDLDLCFRIKERGWKVLYYPGVTVLHHKGASSRQRSFRSIYEFYRAMYLFHDKHYRAKTFFMLNWLVVAGIACLGAMAVVRNALRPPARRRVASA